MHKEVLTLMSSTFPILENYCSYMLAALGRAESTVMEYKYDLILFARFMKLDRGKVPADTPLEEIDISDIDVKFLNSVTTDDLLAFIIWLSRSRKQSNSARARHIASLRSFFKYLHSKKRLIDSNPAYDIETPKIGKRLPKYLTLEQSQQLLKAAYDSPKESNERDYCMLTLFLNCGLRISELTALDLSDITADSIRVFGKGSKERVVYLNNACVDALNDYLKVRASIAAVDRRALFLSSRRTRISRSTVHSLVKKHLLEAGLDSSKYSSHKLRHTAATLMLQNGVDVRTLQELLGHEHLNTTQIYTHVENSSLRDAAQRSPLSDIKPSSPGHKTEDSESQ